MAGRTVLIAEDDEHLRLLMRDLLQMEGYTVVEAQDALETVQALDAHGGEARFAVVLLDIAQSHDGLHVLGHMAGQRDRTPVIALSVSEEGLESALEAGARAGLLKPFEIHELLSCVHRVVA
ncbi:MAG TPA: response regulator [Chloroflexota bacterium]|nr:response regulator [Chloroflexota bacterium]